MISYPGGVLSHLMLETRLALPANTTAVKHVLLSRPDASETAYTGTTFTELAGSGKTAIGVTSGLNAAMIGATTRWVTGTAANIGVVRVISGVSAATDGTIDALPANHAIGDTFVVERINSGWRNIVWWLDTGAKCHVSFAGSTGTLSPLVDSSIVNHLKSKDPIYYVWFQTVAAGVADQSGYGFNCYGW